MVEKKTKKLGLMMSHELYESLRNLAANRGMTLQEALTYAVELWVYGAAVDRHIQGLDADRKER